MARRVFVPLGIHCLGCGEVRPHHQLKGRPKIWSCDYCGTHTHPTAGTIFHKSKTSLKTWFHAIYSNERHALRHLRHAVDAGDVRNVYRRPGDADENTWAAHEKWL